MAKSKENKPAENKESVLNNDDLFNIKQDKPDEIESDGSASAFDETENVSEDNFDNLSEK